MTYDPSANLTARALREAYRTPPADDLPDYDVMFFVTPDGTVKTRPATVLEVLDRIVARCEGEVRADG